MACFDFLSLDGKVHDLARIDFMHRYLLSLKMETGICKKLVTDIVPVEAKEINAVNTTITKTSSTDAPANINCGIL